MKFTPEQVEIIMERANVRFFKVSFLKPDEEVVVPHRLNRVPWKWTATSPTKKGIVYGTADAVSLKLKANFDIADAPMEVTLEVV